MSISAIYNVNESLSYTNVRTTPTQKKKFHTQMSVLEKELVKEVLKVKNYSQKAYISPHLKEKMELKGITFDEKLIRKTIKEFDLDVLLEVNYNEDKSVRVLMKTRETRKVKVDGKIQDCILCFVLNLKNFHIATCYWNSPQQVLRTPNLSRYSEDLDLVKHLIEYVR